VIGESVGWRSPFFGGGCTGLFMSPDPRATLCHSFGSAMFIILAYHNVKHTHLYVYEIDMVLGTTYSALLVADGLGT
jgi:hypothetical protein